MQTLLLNADDVDENAEMDRVIDAVRGAFTAYERGDAKMPAKSYIGLAAVGPRTTDEPQCPNCGGELDPEIDFCPWCTVELEWEQPPPEN
jgi:ornithine cyclodeaminase/alanine dehydrogenase-like protein (mu-crystallin family)